MKKNSVAAFLWLSAVMFTPCVFGQGSLTPPGAPAPTMKTLEQVEPRIPISSLPYTITNAGSYYVTDNLNSAVNGIVINASYVTVDLMGYSLDGMGGSGDYGIHVYGTTNAVLKGVRIRNGNIHGFGQGIWMENVRDSNVSDIIATETGIGGISLRSCTGIHVSGCTMSGNARGLVFDGFFGYSNHNTVSDCIVRNNTANGIWFRGDSGECMGNRVKNCLIAGTGQHGLYITTNGGEASGNIIENVVVQDSGWMGMYLSSFSGTAAGNRVLGCTFEGNVQRGIFLSGAVGGSVEDCHVSGTTDELGTTYGIWTSSTTNNVVVRNICIGHDVNYAINANDEAGPITTTFGGGFGATDAWANLSVGQIGP